MKRIHLLATLLLVILATGLLVLLVAAQGPDTADKRSEVDGSATGRGAGINNVGSSTLDAVSPRSLPLAAPFDLCFNVVVRVPDGEYVDRFDVDLPDGWTVTTVYHLPDTGCGNGSEEGVAPGNLVYWQTIGYPSACGAWGQGSYDFCANVTVPGSSGAPWTLPWSIEGDTYADPPHAVTGDFGPLFPAGMPNLSASYKQAPATVVAGEPVSYTIVISNVGDVSAINAVVTDVIPAGATYLPNSVACASGTCWYDPGDDAVYWTGAVSAGGEVMVTFAVDTAVAGCGDTIANRALVAGPGLLAGADLEATTDLVARIPYLEEGFEGPTFPPPGWAAYDPDGGDPRWLRSTAYPYSGAASAVHPYATAGMQDGWLVTPVVTPAMSTELRFWEYTAYPEFYYKHSLWACTTACASPPANYTELVEFGDPDSTWRQQVVRLDAFAGQGVRLALRYQGDFADSWYIDDLSIVDTCFYASGGACPGRVVDYQLTVANAAPAADTLDITWSGNLWPTAVYPASLDIPAHGTALVTVAVTVPWSAVEFATDVVTVTATGHTSGLAASAATRTTRSVVQGPWQVMAPLPAARALEAVVGAGNYIFVIGGASNADGSLPTSTTFRYDIAANTWMTMAAMPVALSDIDAGLVGTRIYVPGGRASTWDDTTYVYDIPGDSWSVLAASGTFTGAMQYSVAVEGSTLYRLGGLVADGAGGHVSTARVWALDTGTRTWSELPPMQRDRTSFAAGSIAGKLYVAGGVHYPNFAPEMSAEMFDGSAWHYLADVPAGGGAYTRWSYSAAATAHGLLWLVGGRRTADWSVLDHTGLYDPASGSWLVTPVLPPLNQGRVYLQGAAAGGYLFATGGRNAAADAIYSTHERLAFCPTYSYLPTILRDHTTP